MSDERYGWVSEEGHPGFTTSQTSGCNVSGRDDFLIND